MGVFDFFKSKEEKTFDKILKHRLAVLFPNGEVDIERDVKRVHLLLQGKLTLEECRNCVIGSKTLIYTAEDKSAEEMVPSIMARTHNKSTAKEAYQIYAYLSGEAMYLDRLSTLGISGEESAKELFQNGIDADELPDGFGAYGFTETNPILTISSYGSEDYLNRLRFNGQSITYVRLGSTSSDVSKAPIDRYHISCTGKSLSDIYICPYHRRNSKRVPTGYTFSLSNNVTIEFVGCHLIYNNNIYNA
jgi:hypothetical protein